MNEVYNPPSNNDWTLIMLHLSLRPLYIIVLLSVRDIHGTVVLRSASTPSSIN